MGPQAPKTPKQRDKLNAMLTEIDEDGSGEISFDESPAKFSFSALFDKLVRFDST